MKRASACIIKNEAGLYFLCRRGEATRDYIGKWENAGGGIEVNETYEEAIKRELMEELGAEIEITGELYTDKFQSEKSGQWEVKIFAAEFISPPIIVNYKITSAIGWFSPVEISKLDLASYTRSDYQRLNIIT